MSDPAYVIDGRGDQWNRVGPDQYRMHGTEWVQTLAYVDHHYGIQNRGPSVSAKPNNVQVLSTLDAEIEERTGRWDAGVAYVSNPTPTSPRIVFHDGVVSLGYAEAVIHAAAILSKLPPKRE